MTANRRIFLNIVATYGRSLYALVIGLFCGRWTFLTLGEVDYGLMGVIGGLISFVAFFQGLLSGGVGRFYALSIGAEEVDYKKGLEDCRAWFTTSVLVNTSAPLFLLLVGYPLGAWAVRNYLTIPPDRVEECLWVWRFTSITFIVNLICSPFRAMYGAKQEIAELTVYGFVTSTLNVFFLYYAVHHPGVWLAKLSAWTCFLSVAPSVIIAFRSFRKYQECRFTFTNVHCLDRIKQLLWWNGWITIGALAELSRRQGVSVLINKSFGPKTNAAWNVGNTLSAQCTALSGSLLWAFSPAIFNAWGAGKFEQAKQMGYRVCKLSVLFIMIFAIPLGIEVNEILHLWLKKPPAQSAIICIFVLLAAICEKMTDGLRMVINAKGDMARYQIFVGGIGLITAMPLSLLFIAMGLSVYYIAFAVMLSWLLQSLMRVVLAKFLIKCSPWYWFSRVFIPLFAVGVLTALFGFMPHLFMKPSLFRVIVTALFSTIAILPLSWFLLFGMEEREFVWTRLSHFLKKKKGL